MVKALVNEFNCEVSTAKAAIHLFGEQAAERMRNRSYEDFCAIARAKPQFIVEVDEPEFVLVD